jgi:hypothetical protein
MLAPVRSDGPAAPGVVVDLRDAQLPRYRHPQDYGSRRRLHDASQTDDRGRPVRTS